MPVSISEWLGQTEWTQVHGLHRLVQDALLYEVTKVIDQRNSEQNRAKQDQKLKELESSVAVQPLAHQLGGIKPYFQ